VKKLTHEPESAETILSKPKVQILGPVEISMHESKSGNQCVKVKYVTPGLLSRYGNYGLSEFFVVNSPWAMQRLELRLGDVGATLPSIPFVGIITAPGSFEVASAKEGKYDRVISVKKISEQNPGDRDENMSFEFEEEEGEEPWWSNGQKESDLTDLPF
jgi:hypothetical protein